MTAQGSSQSSQLQQQQQQQTPVTAGFPAPVATCAMQSLTKMNVMSPYLRIFSKDMAFRRAIKVFCMSYAGYDQLCPELYRTKLDTFIESMQGLYGEKPDYDFVTDINRSLTLEKLELTIQVLEFSHREGIVSAKINFITHLFDKEIDLTVDRQKQLNKLIEHPMNYDQYRSLRVDNHSLAIELEIIMTDGSQQMAGTSYLQFCNIHTEGLYSSMNFGDHESVLLKMSFKVIKESGYPDQLVASYHMHSLIYALQRRLFRWRIAANNNKPKHQPWQHRTTAKFRRDTIDYNSDQAFWSSVPATKLTDAGLSKQIARFIDLQTGFFKTDHFDGSGSCLCTEWCNWVAFFHHNPIYRFLFVQHCQLYFPNRANLPEMYMYTVAYHLYNSRLGLPISAQTPDTPLLRLMADAVHYKNVWHKELYLKNHQFRTSHEQTHPMPVTCDAILYKVLRWETPIYDLCVQSDWQPLGLICSDNFIQYSVRLAELHKRVAQRYISRSDDKKWSKELELVHRNNFRQFLTYCCQLIIQKLIIGTDRLFHNEDKDNMSSRGQSTIDKRVQQLRKHVWQLGADGNPLNVQYFCQPIINSYLLCCRRFVMKFEATIGKARSQGIEPTCQCFISLDSNFVVQHQISRALFSVHKQWSPVHRLYAISVPLMVCYTLRLYSLASDLQRLFVEYLAKAYADNRLPFQAFKDYNHVFDNEFIEETIRDELINIVLFTQTDKMFKTVVNDFYLVYWRRPNHEVLAKPSSDQCLQSALFQYNRLYFWWRNGGNQRPKFTRILAQFADTIDTIIGQSDRVFDDYILKVVYHIMTTYDYSAEVLDHLVYYLVKSVCFMIVRAVTMFHQCLYSLTNQQLVGRNESYALSKPGWIPVFRTTLETVGLGLESLAIRFCLYDDENNRIANTVAETRQLVKQIYRVHYTWLITQFTSEMITVATNTRLTTPDRLAFGCLHLANGLAFIGALTDQFRRDSRWYRMILTNQVLVASALGQQAGYQIDLQQFEPVIDQYMADPIAIETGQPFMPSTVWYNQLQPLFAKFDTETEQTLKIDLSVANTT